MACHLLTCSEPMRQLEFLWHYDCIVSPRGKQSPASCHSEDEGGPDSPTGSASTCASAVSEMICDPEMVERVFETFDENHDGKLTAEELRRGFERLGIVHASEEEVEEEEGEGEGLPESQHLRFDEFLLLCQSACTASPSPSSSRTAEVAHHAVNFDGGPEEEEEEDLEVVLEAFRLFDKDRNGFISPAELQSVLCSLGFPQGRDLQACVHMIERVDQNGDGQIDFSEFRTMLGLPSRPLV